MAIKIPQTKNEVFAMLDAMLENFRYWYLSREKSEV